MAECTICNFRGNNYIKTVVSKEGGGEGSIILC